MFEEHRNSIGILQEFEALSNSFAYGSDYYQFPMGKLWIILFTMRIPVRDLLIIGHGVTGNKDRPFVVSLAEAVEEEGLSVLRFSFAGNGGSGGDFRECTISKEVEDLKAVITAAVDNGYKVTYAGHSMGGAVGVLAAASDERIGNLISLAGMVNTQAFYDREFGEETPDEGCMWEEADCPLL